VPHWRGRVLEDDAVAVSVLLVIAIGLFVGLVVIPHLHFLVVALAHLLHPHILGIVAAFVAVTLLLLALMGFFWAAPGRVVAPAQPFFMRAEPGHAVMEVRDAPTATKEPQAVATAGDVSSVPTWAKLAPLAIILLGIAIVVALIANPHFRAFLQSRPAAIILAACPIVAILLLLPFRTGKMSTDIESARPAFEHRDTSAPLPPAYRTVGTKATLPPTPQKSLDSGTPRVASAETAAEEPEDDPAKLPAWVHREPLRTDGAYYVVVSTGDYTDPFAREERLNALTASAAADFIIKVMRRPAEVVEAVKFNPEYLRSAYVDAQYPSTGSVAAGDRFYQRLKFDSHFEDEVDRRWRQFVSDDHLQKLSGYSAVGMALLGVVYIYLRATSRKQAS
jgi:hypothetical protein